jgi:hypothetical protein
VLTYKLCVIDLSKEAASAIMPPTPCLLYLTSEYRLTRRGDTLRPVLQALYDWGTTMARDLDAIIEPPG